MQQHLLVLLFTLSSLSHVLAQSHNAPQVDMRCSKSDLFGSVVDQDTHCVLGFPLQRTLNAAASQNNQIVDAESCWQVVCSNCSGCSGIDWNAATQQCGACFSDEAPFASVGFTVLEKEGTCTLDSDCDTQHCDANTKSCYSVCTEDPASNTCSIWDLGTSQDLIIPDSPIFTAIFDSSKAAFLFSITTVFTRQQSTYVIGLDSFVDTRAISEVGLCENREPSLFAYDNRAWWCSPSDASGIGSLDHFAWGPSATWNQTALDCNHVKFARHFTINDLTKVCSKPGSVIATSTPQYIQYDGTFHITLAQDDSDWSLRSLVPLAKWNYPFVFEFTRDFKIVATLVAEQISTKVKQGVSVFDGNRFRIFVDTRIDGSVYGPNAYVKLVSGMDTTNQWVVFPSSNPGKGLVNAPQGTRTQNSNVKRAIDDGTPCVFPQCQQVWDFLSLAIPDDANFAGVYTSTYEVWGSTKSPNQGIDRFTLSITIDPTFVPETVTAIDNINLGSKLALYDDSQFSNIVDPQGYRASQTVYSSQSINLSLDDKNLWELELQSVTICLVVDGSYGCGNNPKEIYVLFKNGTLQQGTPFAPTFYAPGTVPGNRFSSVTGISFLAAPLANKQPASRTFFIEFVSLASIVSSNGKKRYIQQNAKVDESLMLNFLDDPVSLNVGDDNKVGDGNMSNVMIPLMGAGVVTFFLLFVALSVFLVMRYKQQQTKKKGHEIIINTVESDGVAI